MIDDEGIVEGSDAAHKLAILVGLCFTTTVDVSAIPRDGIDLVEPVDLAYAKKFDYVIKPLNLRVLLAKMPTWLRQAAAPA